MDETKVTSIGDLPPNKLVINLDQICRDYPTIDIKYAGAHVITGTRNAAKKVMGLLFPMPDMGGLVFRCEGADPDFSGEPTSEPGPGTSEAPASQVAGADTREKLEEDVHRASELFALRPNAYGSFTGIVTALLDRQAAITEREWRAYMDDCVENPESGWRAENERLKAVVRTQADSFAKLERELAEARSAS